MSDFDISIKRSKRGSIAIVILPDGIVEVRAPKYFPEFAIRAFVKSKTDWIEKRLAVVKKHKVVKKQFVNGEKFLFLGNEYVLQLGNYVTIQTDKNNLLFPLGMAYRGKYHLEKWYESEAKKIIKSLVDEYSKKLNLPYAAISFSDTKSKWGSCSSENKLQFNWRLIMAPLLVIRYVVIHELVHTIHKDHQAIFWNKVRQVNPSYKQQIKWLKLNGGRLQNI
jgi:predicted metal-dependent hydrolase